MICKISSFSEVSNVSTKEGDKPKREYFLTDAENGNKYYCVAWGDLAQVTPQQGQVCFARLWFNVREYQGKYFQEITITSLFIL